MEKKPLCTSLISFTSHQTLYSFSLFSFKYYFLIIFYSFFIQQNSTPITIKKKTNHPKIILVLCKPKNHSLYKPKNHLSTKTIKNHQRPKSAKSILWDHKKIIKKPFKIQNKTHFDKHPKLINQFQNQPA